MISHIYGKVTEKEFEKVIVDVSGVGYEIFISKTDYEKILIEENAKFFTYHHIREQSQELFGFLDKEAKSMFQKLITVQGVGPRAAISILGLSEARMIRQAISSSNVEFIKKANGIGKKTAERIIVDLKDKLGGTNEFAENLDGFENESILDLQDEAMEALVSLGYSYQDAKIALMKIDKKLPVDERIKLALRSGL